MQIIISPNDIIQRCLWDKYKKFCLHEKDEKEIEKIIESNKPVSLNENDAYVIGLLKVIETDNLRRDFTFNLKVTTPGLKISVKAGDMIAAILPVPRFSVENYKITPASAVMSQDVIKNERSAGARFAVERSTVDIHKPNKNGRRYSKGVDIYDNPFYQHQKTVRPPT